jgi:hypothetical protein
MNTEMVYKTESGKILVSLCESERQGKWVQGSMFGILETGRSANSKLIRAAIKKFSNDNGLNISDISHSIYGIYAANVIN